MMTKKGSIFSAPRMPQWHRERKGCLQPPVPLREVYIPQASKSRHKAGPQKSGAAAQLLLQQPGTTKPHQSGWKASFGFIEWSFTLLQKDNKSRKLACPEASTEGSLTHTSGQLLSHVSNSHFIHAGAKAQNAFWNQKTFAFVGDIPVHNYVLYIS